MKNSFLIVILAIFMLPINLKAQTRSANKTNNGQWRQIYDGRDKGYKYFSNGILDQCPICQSPMGSYDSLNANPSFGEKVVGNEYQYTCKECNSVFKVVTSTDYSKPHNDYRFSRLTVSVKKGERKQQTREHLITDKCIAGRCFNLEGTSPDMPSQFIRITRSDSCKYIIEFTVTEVETNKSELHTLPPNADYEMSAEGNTYIISNINHVSSSGPEVNNQQTNSKPQKKSNTQQRKRGRR